MPSKACVYLDREGPCAQEWPMCSAKETGWAGTTHPEVRTTECAGQYGGGSTEGIPIFLGPPATVQSCRKRSQWDSSASPSFLQGNASS